MHMCNAHGNVIHTKCSSHDQTPEPIRQCNQWTHCQQHFTQTYKINYNYTAVTFAQVKNHHLLNNAVFKHKR